jgi:hypothetical protein
MAELKVTIHFTSPIIFTWRILVKQIWGRDWVATSRWHSRCPCNPNCPRCLAHCSGKKYLSNVWQLRICLNIILLTSKPGNKKVTLLNVRGRKWILKTSDVIECDRHKWILKTNDVIECARSQMNVKNQWRNWMCPVTTAIYKLAQASGIRMFKIKFGALYVFWLFLLSCDSW